jgi:DNA-binding PadR family transcriptional regulator
MTSYTAPGPERFWGMRGGWPAPMSEHEGPHDRHERHTHRGRRRRGGPPGWGPMGDPGGFGPRDPGGFGPRGPFRGRRAARGDVRASVLALLAEEPMHGYQIITELAERSNGAWRPSPGSVYPVIQQLQDEGLVRIEETDGRRVVHLTPAGERYVTEHADELTAPWEAVGFGPDEATWGLLTAAKSLAGAAWQVAQAGTRADVEKATAVLADARRRLYGILADGGAGSQSDSATRSDLDGSAEAGPSDGE